MRTLLSTLVSPLRFLIATAQRRVGFVLFLVIVFAGLLSFAPSTVRAQATAITGSDTSGLTSRAGTAISNGAAAVGATGDATAAKGANAAADALAKAASDSFVGPLTRFLASTALLGSRLILRLASFCVDFILVIAGYNGYLGSAAVNAGWTIVRDITNMLFIVFLLAIAFATILGLEGYEWKQLLPKLVIAAVLVNFSRTICGVIIDAAQVVMLSFLNAISGTIGGNLINALRLPSFEAFNSAVKPDQVTSPGILMAALVALFFSLIVLLTLFAYVWILLARIIRLWVLIVLSPFAFVLNILPSTQGFASRWWSEFIDNVITGPVIVFFIWLALIVVGTGQANQELLQANGLADKTPIEQAFGPQEQKAGPTDILGWNNLANFLIAIGMLFAGAEVASHIGGSSGNLLQGALDTAKGVAKEAAGVYLAQRVLSKGKGLAGSVITSGFGAFPAIKGTAKGLYKGASYLREKGRPKREELKKLEEAEKEKEKSFKFAQFKKKQEAAGGLKGLYYGARAALGTPSSFKDKELDTIKAITAANLTQAKEAISISSTPLGLAKRDQERFAADLIREGAAGKANKEAQGRLAEAKGFEYIDEQLKLQKEVVSTREAELKAAKVSGTKDDVEKAEDKLNAAKDGLEKQRQELLNPSNPNSVIQKFKDTNAFDPATLIDRYDLNKKTFTSEAKVAELKHHIADAEGLQLARQRDQLAISHGTPELATFESQERVRQRKAGQAHLAAANYDLTIANVKDLSNSLANLNSQITAASAAGDSAKAGQLKGSAQQLIRQISDLDASNAARGAIFASSGQQAALEKLKSGLAAAGLNDVASDDVVGQQALKLSSLLQKVVNKADVPAAFAELQAAHKDNFDAFMESYIDSLDSAARNGAVNFAGLFRSTYDTAAKKMRYGLVDYDTSGSAAVRSDGKTDATWSNEKRENALSSLTCRIDSIAQSLDVKAGSIAAESRAAVRNIAEAVGSVTRNQAENLSKDLLAQLREASNNTNSSNIETLLRALASKSTDARGLEALLSKIDSSNIKAFAKNPTTGKAESYEEMAKRLKSLNERLEDVLNTIPKKP
jgi:hypothetical protein